MSKQGEQKQTLMEVYKELCTNIRMTTDTSFKLLGAVPAISTLGSGIVTELSRDFPVYGLLGISALGAVITVGLFSWELRNIQNCNWLIGRAANVEQLLFPEGEPRLQYHGIAKPQDLKARERAEIKLASLWTRPWGKTQATKLIYGASVFAWLVPIGIAIGSLVWHPIPAPG